MGEIHKRMDHHTSTKCLVVLSLLGSIFIIVACVLIFFNPILMVVNMKLRLANGTLLHELLQKELQGLKLAYFLFNVTNADAFKAGEEDVLRLKEVGPFVYQEYRTNDDLELNIEPGLMRYTPNHRTELILEESIGRPEDFFLVLPNIALLSAVQLLSKYPYFIGQIFKVLTSGMNRDPLFKINVQQYLWNNTDPILSSLNTAAPGLFYYNSTGLLTRLYDPDAKYRLTLGTTELDKFQIKSIEKFFVNEDTKSRTILESSKAFRHTYEGVVFPPKMTPDMPIAIHRHRVCKNLELAYAGKKHTSYGSEAFVYNFANTTFNDHKACDSKGWCPRGILDLSPCFEGFPFVISKGHFLDTEEKVFEKIEGLQPNRSLHDSTLTVDPNIGVSTGISVSMQTSMALGDMSLLKETRRLSNIFLPIAHCVASLPKMPEEADNILHLLYTTGHYMLISSQVLSALLGVGLITYAARNWRREDSSVAPSNKCPLISRALLIKNNN